MKKAKILIHPAFEIGEISPRLYGAFLEPIGTMVNGSMYNPKHPTADDKGFRRDWIDALKESGVPAVRLPGGNFVSGWDWKDSIGPMEERKVRLDPAWSQYIPNDVGHDEYLAWAERVGTEAMYTINLGTGDINDAMKIIDYTNHPSGSYWSDLRRKYGREAPYGVKTWYLGNEMDGPWQIGSWLFNPKGYGVLANEVSKVMKMIDPTIETVVCASTSSNMPHYPQWDIDVLEQCYAAVDYISLHMYHSAPPEDYAALLGGSRYFEDYIEQMKAICDVVKAKYRSPKTMLLSFDEYGTMARQPAELNPGRGLHNFLAPHYNINPERKFTRHDPDNMYPGSGGLPPFRHSEMLSALSAASTILTFLRHADRVKIGCMTGGLHTLAGTNREHTWKPAGYHVLTQLMRYGRGVSLKTVTDCETFDIPGYIMGDNEQLRAQKDVGFIDTAAAYDKNSGELNIFVLNRDWQDGHTLEIDAAGFELAEHIQLFSEDMDAANSPNTPDKIAPSVNKAAKTPNGKIIANVQKLSWNVFKLK